MASQEEMNEAAFRKKFEGNSEVLKANIHHSLHKSVSTNHHDIETIQNSIVCVRKFEEVKSTDLKVVMLRRKLIKKYHALAKLHTRVTQTGNHGDLLKYNNMWNEISKLEQKIKGKENKPVNCGSNCKFCGIIRGIFNLKRWFNYGG